MRHEEQAGTEPQQGGPGKGPVGDRDLRDAFGGEDEGVVGRPVAQNTAAEAASSSDVQSASGQPRRWARLSVARAPSGGDGGYAQVARRGPSTVTAAMSQPGRRRRRWSSSTRGGAGSEVGWPECGRADQCGSVPSPTTAPRTATVRASTAA